MMKSPSPLDDVTSRKMSAVRSKGTPAELAVRKVLRRLSVGYRINVRKLPGTPDAANKTNCWAIFVHGCFWHQHPGCPKATVPKNNRDFWEEKFKVNNARDVKNIRDLATLGFRSLTVWECQTKNPTALEKILKNFFASL
jgi:DNA mismatch endonuclease (patch repair protein)